MNKPPWLREVREFCRGAGIEITGWGADTLIVTAKSPDGAQQIASQLGPFGFTPVENEEDAYAGLLTLSLHPAATRNKIASFNVSQRPLNERLIPLIWGALSIGLFVGHFRSRWLNLVGVLPTALFLWYGVQIWGWALEVLPQELRVRRRWRWSSFAWDEIRGIETAPARGRDQEAVILKLVSNTSESLGSFWFAFARNMRDRLGYEIAKRRYNKLLP